MPWDISVSNQGSVGVLKSDSVVCVGTARMTALQAAVDPLDGVALVFGNDAFLDVRVDLLVHEVLQLGKVVIWNKHAQIKRCGIKRGEF